MKDRYERNIKKDIAIVGMSGKFAQSPDLDAFWENLVAGTDLSTAHTREELEELGVSQDLLDHKDYIKRSLLLEDAGSFDYSFFGYTKEEAALMDPQVRLMHEQTWLALENAGYNPFEYAGKIGCFYSASDNLNWRTHAFLSKAPNVSSYLINQLSDRVSISRLIAYKLNLKGPATFIDTACSSSLVAIHTACRSLLLRECNMALSGGIRLNSSVNIGYMHQEGMIFSKDGYCRAFDKDASGTTMGEGVGIVLLKRLEDALNDNDHIHAVIRGSAVNNDGSRKVGFTAPGISGQYECIKSAQKFAGVSGSDITYVEAHGTGTKLGDPVEIEALNKAFDHDTSHQCGVGSVKTNVGHLDAAAGVAGLLKAALTLKNKTIPPSINFTTSNPEIAFEEGPFYVNNTTKKLESEKTMCAAVSSFGIGGTNAHIILENALPQNNTDSSKSASLIPLSAKTKKSLESLNEHFIAFLKQNPSVNVADLAYTMQIGRANHTFRKYVCGSNTADLISELELKNTASIAKDKTRKKLVFMFSGQGSQYFGMAKDIYHQFPHFKNVMDEGFEILEKLTGKPVKAILGYGDDPNTNTELINDTRYTQPLLFLVEYAFANLLISLGLKPDQMIGHSLGEYVAACLSEVFSFQDGLRLIVRRAELMSDLEKGDMLNVALSAAEVSTYISSDVSIAAINTMDTSVLSGNKQSIQKVSEKLMADEIGFTTLRTSHAFHSEMMDDMLEDYAAELDRIELSPPKIPFVSCTTGKPIESEEATSSTYWVNHLRQPVNFVKGLDFLTEQEFSAWLEIGAAKTLSGFLRQHKNYKPEITVTSISRHPKETVDDTNKFLSGVGKLWSKGLKINWDALYENETRNRIPAPTYVFERVIFPSRVDPIGKMLMHNNGQQINGIEDFNVGDIADATQDIDSNNQAENRFDFEAAYAPPETPTEMELEALWRSLFGYDKIGVNDDFFELGGDSLKAITLLRRIHKSFDIEVNLNDFFNKSNIRALSEEIDLAKEIKGLNKPEKSAVKTNRIKI